MGAAHKEESGMAHRLGLHRLPAPLTFYVRINALSESHLSQVAKLKDVYGPDLLRDLSQWKWNYPPAGDPCGLLYCLTHCAPRNGPLHASVPIW